jgi:hypothetical protein
MDESIIKYTKKMNVLNFIKYENTTKRQTLTYINFMKIYFQFFLKNESKNQK